MRVPLMLVIWLTLIGAFLLSLRELVRKPDRLLVSHKAALEAVGLMKDWGSWMTTMATAVIGANGFLLKSGCAVQTGTADAGTGWAYTTILFMALSIAAATWVLAALPSIVSRLNEGPASPENDIYELRIFSFVPVRLAVVSGWQHALFILGLYCFALFIAGAPQCIVV